MLPKPHRIRKQKDFDRIYSKNKRIKSKNFQLLLHYVNTPEIGEKLPKFGFVVSKKVGNAVIRNRFKRLLREVVRLELPNLKPNFEAVIIAFPQIVEQDFYTLKEEIVGIIKSENLEN